MVAQSTASGPDSGVNENTLLGGDLRALVREVVREEMGSVGRKRKEREEEKKRESELAAG